MNGSRQKINSYSYNLILSCLSFHSCLSHSSSYTQTHFNHGATWQQISVSILNLINGNDSSVIHLSWVAFIFLSVTGEWTLSGWRPTLVIAHSPKDWHLEDRFLATMENATILACDFFLFFHIIFFPNIFSFYWNVHIMQIFTGIVWLY